MSWLLLLAALSSFEAAEKRYGKIKNGRWANKDKWLVYYDMTRHRSISMRWYRPTGKKVLQFLVNKDIVGPLHQALACIEQTGQGHTLTTFAGAFNIRKIRGTNKWSTHAYGLAVDINAHNNKVNLIVVSCFKASGWTWGGDFSKPDPHHFSYAWESN